MATQVEPTKVKQIEPDGSIVDDYDPEQVTFEEHQQIIELGLQGKGWNVTFLQSDKQKRYRRFSIQKGDVSLTIEAYIFTNLAWSRRAHDEKRIQITRPYGEHADHFSLPKNGNPRCALLGFYRRQGQVLVCAWNAAAYQNHASTTSCYIRTGTMAMGMRSGFGQASDATGRVVCCFTPDMLAAYLENMQFLHAQRGVEDRGSVDQEADATDLMPAVGVSDMPALGFQPPSIPAQLPRNRICYGAPGTGKSYTIDRDLNGYFPHPGLYQRVTFYPDYTNGAFVGEYKPSPVYRSSDEAFFGPDQKTKMPGMEPLIDYRFMPGPFLSMLCKAYLHPQFNFCLVIEEINRAHASAVFGDAFQMLDRDAQGQGRFAVTLSPEAQHYLTSQGIQDPVRLPQNLYIWATMNSADQGVLPLDAAFKRRWTLEYMAINAGEAAVADWPRLRFQHQAVRWNDFRRQINAHLQRHGITEDRLMGPFFVSAHELADDDVFVNKLLHYLRDDVVRSTPDILFSGDSLTYGALVSRYREGQSIFVQGIDFGGTD